MIDARVRRGHVAGEGLILLLHARVGLTVMSHSSTDDRFRTVVQTKRRSTHIIFWHQQNQTQLDQPFETNSIAVG
jgi:hypothetical protein